MDSSPNLFSPFAVRGRRARNRVVVSPMAMYRARDGHATEWHLAHLSKFAFGGAGVVFAEATAVAPEGRVTYGDVGLWTDAHIAPLRRTAALIQQAGALAGIQIAHGGRKACMQRPWHGNGPLGETDFARGETPWRIVGPTHEPFAEGWLRPHELAPDELADLRRAYATAAGRAAAAGFDVLEIHGAHGYLLHSFLSPLSNRRDDAYGGNLAGRLRFPLEVVESVRAAWPADRPLFFRVSAVDGVDVGWSLSDSVSLAKELKARGVDVVDCSSGGMNLPRPSLLVSRAPGFQVGFAAAIRAQAGIATMAVGLIRTPAHADGIVQANQADLVALGREMLHNPHWPLHAAQALGRDPDWRLWPEQYGWWLKRRARQMAALGLSMEAAGLGSRAAGAG
jgi:2,4-dienoyl-CoA reductase-like NADH-dependent reductase (Old Yellow Enzyme family)